MNTVWAARRADHQRATAPAEVPARPRRKPHLQVVEGASKRSRRSRGKVIAAVAVVTVFVTLFGLVVFQTMLVQSQSRLDELDADLSHERERTEQLSLEIAELESPERVIAEAGALGLVEPDQVLMLPSVATSSTP